MKNHNSNAYPNYLSPIAHYRTADEIQVEQYLLEQLVGDVMDMVQDRLPAHLDFTWPNDDSYFRCWKRIYDMIRRFGSTPVIKATMRVMHDPVRMKYAESQYDIIYHMLLEEVLRGDYCS